MGESELYKATGKKYCPSHCYCAYPECAENCTGRPKEIKVIDIRSIISTIKYKPGLKFKTWTADSFIGVQLYQEIGIDTETGKRIAMEGHCTYIPCNASREVVIRELYFLCLRWETHELQEFFKVDGKRPFNPHHSIDDLMQLD